MKRKSKRFKKLVDQRNKEKVETLINKIDLIKKMSNTKFTESIDLSFKINLKKIKGADPNLRTIIELPNGSGKKFKVAVLCDENKLNEAKKSGADVYGSDDLIQKISSGKINFDKLICTPSMMAKLGKLGKILGPKGLMPNPKLGTVSDDIINTVSKIKNKIVEIKNDKDGNVGLSVGRKTFASNKILENINFVFQGLKKDKSAIFNNENIKNFYLSASMSPGLKFNFKEVQS